MLNYLIVIYAYCPELGVKCCQAHVVIHCSLVKFHIIDFTLEQASFDKRGKILYKEKMRQAFF
jgi:hypothetical protein